ncbi:hypothetical protein RUM44_008902 [Polyplax serrata]|uniref:Tudor domain-containing protein n=1 Tax=Polyplax serrata TaxID=468196 RepID=A0ABR1AR41_POLSC
MRVGRWSNKFLIVDLLESGLQSGKLEVRNDPCAILKNHRIQENVEDLFRPKIHILSVESPSHIYVTFPDLLVGMVKLHKELNGFYKNSVPLEGDKKWTAGERCVIYSYLENIWYRAVVLEVLSSDQVKVFLVDTAKIVTESFSNLRLLNESFQKYPPCAIKCHMSDVYPVGDSWPAISCEFLISEIDSFSEIYITKRGEIKQGSLPVELWVQGQKRTWENNDSTGQLTNKQINWISLNRLMVNEGLALPLTRNTIFSCLMLGENLSASPSRSERTELKVNNKNVKVEASCSSLISRNQWLPPMPLKRSSFIGVPTYVGAETEIYLYDVEEDGDKLQHIKEKLSHKYDDSEPDISNFWVAGDMCIAKYHGDNSWYRGTILKVNENQSYNVHFVDYGNTEICTASELRKELELTEIPILTHKFYLPKNKSASMHIIEGNVDVSLYLQKNGILGFELA